MSIYRIAGLYVEMKPKYNKLLKQGEKYLINDDQKKADISLFVSDSTLLNIKNKYDILSLEEIEYLYLGSMFYSKLLQFNGFLLHSSAICYKDEAYMFSAPSGTGKSTHVKQWQKYFGNENVIIINDDKPAIRYIDNKFYCCGTPFSGKCDLSSNILVPLKAIVFIKRGKENKIDVLNNKTAIYKIFEQTLRDKKSENMNILTSLMDELLKNINIYELQCDISTNAAKVAYEGINSIINNK